MADNLDIKITATNQASPAIRQVKSDIQNLDKATGSLGRLKDGLKGIDKSASNVAGGLSGIGKALGVAGIVALGVQAGQAAAEMVNLGAQSLALKSSFEQVQGGAENATNILDGLRAASRGMISDYDLMLAANKSALLGVADTAEEMSAILQIATVRGRAMGLSSTQAFNDIVTGLGRMSPLILDNLGITVDLEKTMESYAATLGKTADSLSDTEKKQALVNAVIASSAGLMDSANASAETLAGQGFAQLDTAWTNFKTSIGESLAPFFDARAKEIAGFIKASSEELDRVTNAENLRIALQDAGATHTAGMLAGITDEGTQRRILKREGGKELAGVGDSLNSVMASYQDAINKFIDASKAGNSEATQAAIANMQMYGDAVMGVGEQYNAIAAILDKPLLDLSALENGRIVFTGLADSIGALSDATRPTAEAIAATNAAIAASAQPVSAFTASFETAAAAIEAAEPKLKAIYDTLLDSGDIEGAGKAYSQIQGIIQEITAEWVRQGIPIENIKENLLPKLLSEINSLIGAQIEAGAAGKTAGADMGSGFLSAIPSIDLVIQAVNALTGAANTAAAATGKAQETGATGWRLKGRRPSVGFADGNPFGVAPTMGRNASDGGVGVGTSSGIAGLMRKLPFVQMQPQGITGGVGASYGGSGGGGGGSIDNEASQLAGRIKSILSGALKSGIDLTGILGREDAVEEPARRLADIAVRGFESPWTAYFQEKFPEIWEQLQSSGDPKGAAAAILKDFEAGLRPELLDKGRAKELVKRALLGEQNMSALANEIAAELSAEMGISLEQAQAAATGALGTGGETGGIGASFGDGVVQGVSDNAVGSRAVAVLVSQLGIKDNLTAVYNAGQTHGAQYGSGFLATVGTNLPGGLIAILVAAVSPGVLATVSAQGGRTGATGSDGGNGGAI